MGLVDLAPLAISCLSRPVVMRSSDAVVGFLRAVPCVQVRLRGRFARPTHALERQPAQPVLRVDLGAREPAENVAAVHAQTPESSRRRRSSSRPPSTALGGSAATRAIRAWDRAGQRHRTRPRPSRPAPPNGCSGHPAGSSSGRSTVQPSTARGATRTRPMTHAARRRCGARDAPQQGRRAAPHPHVRPGIRGYEGPASLRTVKLPLRRFRGPRCCFVLRGRGTAGRAPAASRTRQCSRPRPSRRPSRRDRSRRRRRWRSARPPLPRLARHRLARRPHRSAAPQRRAAAPIRSAATPRRRASRVASRPPSAATSLRHGAARALSYAVCTRALGSLWRGLRAPSPDVSSDGSGGRCARCGLAPRWHWLIRGDPPVIHR